VLITSGAAAQSSQAERVVGNLLGLGTRALLADERLVDVWDDTTAGDRGLRNGNKEREECGWTMVRRSTTK
jgi:hypothetical protein